MTDSEKDAAIQRLADAMMVGTECTDTEDAARGWIVGQCARIAIDEAVVPVWQEQQKAWIAGMNWEPDSDDPQGIIPWSAVCAEEKP